MIIFDMTMLSEDNKIHLIKKLYWVGAYWTSYLEPLSSGSIKRVSQEEIEMKAIKRSYLGFREETKKLCYFNLYNINELLDIHKLISGEQFLHSIFNNNKTIPEIVDKLLEQKVLEINESKSKTFEGFIDPNGRLRDSTTLLEFSQLVDFKKIKIFQE